MGCGKSTLGAALATRLAMPFVDLDDYIEERCECTITQIFEKVGESGFREIEQKALRQLAHGPAAVVACGGGTPCFGANMDIMNSHGITIWLTTTAQRIVSRLVLPEQKAKRPLIAAMPDEQILQYVESVMLQRQASYQQAMLRFDSTYLESPEQIAATASALAQTLKKFF